MVLTIMLRLFLFLFYEFQVLREYRVPRARAGPRGPTRGARDGTHFSEEPSEDSIMAGEKVSLVTGAVSGKRIVIIGGGISGQSCAKKLLAANTSVSITIVQSNEFTEFPPFAPYHVSRPELFKERANTPLGAIYKLENLTIKGITYLIGTVTSLAADKKGLVFADGRKLPFDVLVVASGVHYPVISAEAGETYSSRLAFVDALPAKVAAAKSILLGGTGPVGLEMVMELRRINSDCKIQMVTTAEKLMGWDGAAAQHLNDRLAKCNVTVIKQAKVNDINPAKAVFARANYTLSTGQQLDDVDIFIPYFGVARTEFLPKEYLNESKRGRVRAKLTGQSVSQDNLFIVGTGDQYTNSFADNLNAEADVVSKNITSYFVDKGCPSTLPEASPEPTPFYVHLGLGQFTIMNVDIKGPVFAFCGRFCGCLNPICPCCACCGWPCQFPASECQGKCMGKMLIDCLKNSAVHDPQPPIMAEMSR